MPTFSFTEKEVRTLVRFFDALSKQPPVYQPEALAPLSDKERAAADRIWEKGPCLQCHVVGDLPPNEETKAPNLDYAKHRLRPEWMARWLKNPAEMQPGTEMPALFEQEEDGRWVFIQKDIPEVNAIEGDHVELMIRYLNDGKFYIPPKKD